MRRSRKRKLRRRRRRARIRFRTRPQKQMPRKTTDALKMLRNLPAKQSLKKMSRRVLRRARTNTKRKRTVNRMRIPTRTRPEQVSRRQGLSAGEAKNPRRDFPRLFLLALLTLSLFPGQRYQLGLD